MAGNVHQAAAQVEDAVTETNGDTLQAYPRVGFPTPAANQDPITCDIDDATSELSCQSGYGSTLMGCTSSTPGADAVLALVDQAHPASSQDICSPISLFATFYPNY